jgi:uncharacterized protein Yka (UPF0111/DUF47 family)
MEQLTEFIGILEKHKDEMEKDIVKDLENYLATLIEKEEYKEIFKGATIKLIVPNK